MNDDKQTTKVTVTLEVEVSYHGKPVAEAILRKGIADFAQEVLTWDGFEVRPDAAGDPNGYLQVNIESAKPAD